MFEQADVHRAESLEPNACEAVRGWVVTERANGQGVPVQVRDEVTPGRTVGDDHAAGGLGQPKQPTYGMHAVSVPRPLFDAWQVLKVA